MGSGRKWRNGWLALAVAAVLPVPAQAHPHVFIDTKVTAILDAEGRLTAIRLRWDYDTLVSMVVAEDKGADADFDGTISVAEAKVLDGFDMTWVEGFDGDTMLFLDETPLRLEPGPQDWVTGWEAADGHLWSEHTRRLAEPVDPGAGQVRIVVYDVTDYTAYSIAAAGLTVDPVDGAAGSCRLGPEATEAAEAEGGLLSTVGLFLMGGDVGTEVTVVPTPAAGRVVAMLDCP